jgi:hypothetical protein
MDRYGRFCAGSRQSAALRARDVLLPISIVLVDSCYAFRKSIVPYLVGNEFGLKLATGGTRRVANYIPARRTARVNPLIALRYE